MAWIWAQVTSQDNHLQLSFWGVDELGLKNRIIGDKIFLSTIMTSTSCKGLTEALGLSMISPIFESMGPTWGVQLEDDEEEQEE